MASSNCSLESLPNEILWHILSFLKPGFIAEVLPQVSPSFRALVEDQSLWRRRLYSRWPAQHPTPPDDWVECCRQREEHWDAFRGWEDEGALKHIRKDDAHIAAVDALKFIQVDYNNFFFFFYIHSYYWYGTIGRQLGLRRQRYVGCSKK